jgi:hypothetical protein
MFTSWLWALEVFKSFESSRGTKNIDRIVSLATELSASLTPLKAHVEIENHQQ